MQKTIPFEVTPTGDIGNGRRDCGGGNGKRVAACKGNRAVEHHPLLVVKNGGYRSCVTVYTATRVYDIPLKLNLPVDFGRLARSYPPITLNLPSADTGIHLPVFSQRCEAVDQLLLFQDWLRSHPVDWELYERVKGALAS